VQVDLKCHVWPVDQALQGMPELFHASGSHGGALSLRVTPSPGSFVWISRSLVRVCR
jgi:hypothetical protein